MAFGNLRGDGMVAYTFCALVIVSGIGTPVLAEKDLCDTTILGHPACEVGDFNDVQRSRTVIVSEKPIIRANRAAITEAIHCLKLKKYEKAIGILKGAIAADPSDMISPSVLCEAYVHYGDDLSRRKDLKHAIEQYRLALKAFLPCDEARQRLKEMNVSPKILSSKFAF